jgi:hypothetical protein
MGIVNAPTTPAPCLATLQSRNVAQRRGAWLHGGAIGVASEVPQHRRGFWPSAAKVPTGPSPTVAAIAPAAAPKAGPGGHPNERFMTRVRTSAAVADPAAMPNTAVWRPKLPSPTWRSFLHNHIREIAAVELQLRPFGFSTPSSFSAMTPKGHSL